MSGVSVRTLHWYDEIGLLSPAYHGTNKYRYYESYQLFRLQQVLFFKELGFKLKDIQKLLSQNDFNNVNALREHKKLLEKSVAHKQNLILTIDKTIQHLENGQTILDKELYDGFESVGKGGNF